MTGVSFTDCSLEAGIGGLAQAVVYSLRVTAFLSFS